MPTSLIDALAGLNVEQAVCLAVSLFSGSLVPFFLLVDVDFTVLWQRLRTVAVAVAGVSREAVRDVAALLILLTTRPKGAMSS